MSCGATAPTSKKASVLCCEGGQLPCAVQSEAVTSLSAEEYAEPLTAEEFRAAQQEHPLLMVRPLPLPVGRFQIPSASGGLLLESALQRHGPPHLPALSPAGLRKHRPFRAVKRRSLHRLRASASNLLPRLHDCPHAGPLLVHTPLPAQTRRFFHTHCAKTFCSDSPHKHAGPCLCTVMNHSRSGPCMTEHHSERAARHCSLKHTCLGRSSPAAPCAGESHTSCGRYARQQLHACRSTSTLRGARTATGWPRRGRR